MADQGLGLERLSRIQENKALAEERTAAAEKDREIALLNLVRAAKELEGVDIEHISQLLSLSATLKSQEQASMDQKSNQQSV